ncbi:MAG: type II secretion system F family protein [Planctomycetota bacterium]
MSSVAGIEPRRSPAAHEELALFHRTLADLCRARVPLPSALQSLREQLRSGPLRDATDAMVRDAEEGMPLDEAYEKHARRFPPLYRALVEAGIASGDLAGVLDQIADHAGLRAETLARVRRALAYPLLTGVFVLVIGTLLGVFVLPRLWEAVTTAGLEGAQTLRLPALALLGGLLVVGALGVLAAGPFGGRWRMPVLGPLRDEADRAAYASALALLLRRQVSLPTALRLAAAGLGERLRQSAERVAGEAGRGVPLGERVGEIFEPTLAFLIRSADGSRDLATALDDVSTIHRRRLGRAIDRVETMIVPLAEVILGGIVFLLAYSYIVPMFEWHRALFGSPF